MVVVLLSHVDVLVLRIIVRSVCVCSSIFHCFSMSFLCVAHIHLIFILFFFLMIRRPPRSTLDRSSAASDVYKRQIVILICQYYNCVSCSEIYISIDIPFNNDYFYNPNF